MADPTRRQFDQARSESIKESASNDPKEVIIEHFNEIQQKIKLFEQKIKIFAVFVV